MAEVSSSAATTVNVVKDITEIYSRLFDHKPFLQGEIKFFVKEFEEKRGDREVQKLFEMLEDVTEVRETQIDRACRASDQGLCSLAGNLEVALSMCHRILEAEDKVNSVTGSNPGCGGCISDGGGNVVGPCAQIWVHVKEPQVIEISGALHYGMSHNHMVVLGC
nr:biogenesis of lysosome-related organelles complex 1 subunit 5-like isoform X2 [Rhipicephalus microplus]